MGESKCEHCAKIEALKDANLRLEQRLQLKDKELAKLVSLFQELGRELLDARRAVSEQQDRADAATNLGRARLQSNLRLSAHVARLEKDAANAQSDALQAIRALGQAQNLAQRLEEANKRDAEEAKKRLSAVVAECTALRVQAAAARQALDSEVRLRRAAQAEVAFIRNYYNK
jgi:hypothetical protein